MEEDATLVTREQYIELLIDASFGDASEMESGFTSWCERHVPTWRKQGYDETWIRQRIETAQITRGLLRKLKEQGFTLLEIRDELRKTYADHPELYDLAIERERIQPDLLRYRGNSGDLRQRYTLRVMIYETDKLTFEKFCRWSGLPVPGPDSVFFEQPDHVRVVRDLSTVEELELMLAMSRYALQLFDAPENLTKDQISPLMEAHGKQLRATFIAKYGYLPEDSTTPHDDVVVEYTQSGKRVCGWHNMQALRGHHASKLSFSIRSVLGSCDLWVTEYVISYDERPVYTVSIMEFRDGKVARETQYFAGPFDPPPWRAEWVERRE